MDPTRFDALSRALGREHPRRTALALLAAAPLALGGKTATAARLKKKNPCKAKPNDTPCQGSGRCLSGACHPEPTCGDPGAPCNDASACCGGSCAGAPFPECTARSAAGQACYANDDCVSGLFCVGYVCQSIDCIPINDYCADGASTCGDGGFCLRPLGGGETRCGVEAPPFGSTCGCTSHKQCSKTHGAGAFCAKFTSGVNCFCNGKTTFCAVPA
jgi:hypothetical protein